MGRRRIFVFMFCAVFPNFYLIFGLLPDIFYVKRYEKNLQ